MDVNKCIRTSAASLPARNGGLLSGRLMRLAAPVVLATFGAACAGDEGSSTDGGDGLSDIEQAVERLSARVTTLRDVSDIEKLQRAYGYYVDKAQWPAVAELFPEDGTLEIGGRGVFVGKDRVLEYLVTGLGPIGPRDATLIDHQQFQGIVTVDPGGTTAKGRWTAIVMGVSGWGDVYYENDYVKEDGVWKIQALNAPFNMYSSYDIGWIDRTTPNTRPESFLPPPDLPPSVIYLTFPNYHIEPFHYPNPVTGRPMPSPDPRAGGTAFGRDE